MDPVYEFMRAALEGVVKENTQSPSREGSLVRTKLEEAMMWRRRERQLQGKEVPA